MIKPPSLTVMLQRMSKNGLLKRTVDSQDKRILRLSLTAEGEQLFLQAKHLFADIERQTLAGFNQEELELLNRQLIHIRENLQTKEAVCQWSSHM
jgi:DNA-binding MarR family transcriptional regulator